MINYFSVEFVLIFASFSSSFATKNDENRVRGVQTSLLSMYVPSKAFTCLDGSMTIPFDFVNDDYCDCRDGTDEPGTSACPNGRFFCENKGFVGTFIPSQLVDDGVCDCCDGSDEIHRATKCSNNCFDLAQKSRAENEEKRVFHESALAKKKEILQRVNSLRAERKREIENLQKDLDDLKKLLEENRVLKNQAEIPEKIAKEKYENFVQEEKIRRENEANQRSKRRIFDDLDTNGDSSISIDELKKHLELDPNPNDEFSDHEARSILSKDSVNFDEFSEIVFEQISNSYRKISSADDEEHSSSQTSLEHEKHFHDENVKPDFDDETKILIEKANDARKNFEQTEKNIRESELRIEELRTEEKFDVGPNGEFSELVEKCFDFEQREYTYRVCMFKDAKQYSKGGSNEVLLGFFDSWSGGSTNKYEKMKYARGAVCWNGPARSMVVQFQCGIENRIIDVREPSRCEYLAIFSSPSICDDNFTVKNQHEHSEF